MGEFLHFPVFFFLLLPLFRLLLQLLQSAGAEVRIQSALFLPSLVAQLASEQPILPESLLESGFVLVEENARPVLFPTDPVALVEVAVGTSVDSLSFPFAVHELALVLGAVGVGQSALALHHSVVPVTLVVGLVGLVGENDFAFAVRD